MRTRGGAPGAPLVVRNGGYNVESIIVALITGGLALLGVIYTSNKNAKAMSDNVDAMLDKQQAVMETKLTALEEKVSQHNHLVERMYHLEERTELQEEKIKVANHRIDDLERKSERTQ